VTEEDDQNLLTSAATFCKQALGLSDSEKPGQGLDDCGLKAWLKRKNILPDGEGVRVMELFVPSLEVLPLLPVQLDKSGLCCKVQFDEAGQEIVRLLPERVPVNWGMRAGVADGFGLASRPRKRMLPV
jgi:hypothetical protein